MVSSIHDATRRYERWLREQTAVVEGDLRRKHEMMRGSVFAFLRATYYRWAERWPQDGSDLADGPVVTAIGDLHVENFGTWRDLEGRLAWGVNDFDEAAPLPWTNDIVRLATSATLAYREGRLRLAPKEIGAALLAGYAANLRDGGGPLLLAEKHRKLGERVVQALLDPKSFWTEKVARVRGRSGAPAECRTLLEQALPVGSTEIVVRPRTAGVGSLGRPRFVAVAEWAGGRVAREAKAFVPSATLWASGAAVPQAADTHLTQLLAGAIRSRDPYLRFSSGWILRRLAPDSDKIRVDSLGRARELEFVTLMGAELANVHLATPGAAPDILEDLRRRKPGWLHKAARRMAASAAEDYRAWEKTDRRA